ncbi:hypothetical protein D3D01_15585 [Haloarcula sp. Atlit-7R]|nr:hypothetical protein D3D01_15585 [Haloarcula sp. Atlit-7R]
MLTEIKAFCDCLPGEWKSKTETSLHYCLVPPNEQDNPVEIILNKESETVTVRVEDSENVLLFTYSAPVSNWMTKQIVDDHNLLTILQVESRGRRQDILSIRGPYAKHTPEGISLPGVENEKQFLLE